MNNNYRALVIGTVGLVASACGDDGDSGSGVDSSKKVSELTKDEVTKICKSLPASSASETQFCTYVAASQTTDATQCKALVDACVAQPNENDSQDCGMDDAPTGANCSKVTVGEVETCLKAYLAAQDKVLTSASCGTKPADIGEPSECATTRENCPEILD